MTNSLRACWTGLLAVVLAAAPATAGNVHKVDPTDSTAFANIGDAVAAASRAT